MNERPFIESPQRANGARGRWALSLDRPVGRPRRTTGSPLKNGQRISGTGHSGQRGPDGTWTKGLTPEVSPGILDRAHHKSGKDGSVRVNSFRLAAEADRRAPGTVAAAFLAVVGAAGVPVRATPRECGLHVGGPARSKRASTVKEPVSREAGRFMDGSTLSSFTERAYRKSDQSGLGPSAWAVRLGVAALTVIATTIPFSAWAQAPDRASGTNRLSLRTRL
jgi:hypothetical protein